MYRHFFAALFPVVVVNKGVQKRWGIENITIVLTIFCYTLCYSQAVGTIVLTGGGNIIAALFFYLPYNIEIHYLI